MKHKHIILIAIYIAAILTAALLPRMASAADWAGYPGNDAGFVDTGDWLGWLQVEQQPWIWSELLDTWLYAPDPGAGTSGTWVYSIDFANMEPPPVQVAPVRVPSFGPNGTHWPEAIPTPFMYDTTVPHIIDVACTWSAISSAISGVTTTQAEEGVLIRIAPGTLTGNGGGSTASPVLQNLGSAAWSKRVTVAPRDGWGTIVVTGGARIFNVQSVCFAGFDFDSLAFNANHRSALAWTRVSGFLSANGHSSRSTVSDVEIIEVVIPDSQLKEGDSMDCFSAGTTTVDGWRFAGCYMAPSYRPVGSNHHADSLQFEPTSGGSDFTNVLILDSAFFASNNTAIQVNGLSGAATIEHCYVAAGSTSKSRYPVPQGGDTTGGNSSFNGSGVDLTILDSYVLGSVGSSATRWATVNNTRVNYTPGGALIPTTGSWTFDSGLGPDNPAMPPYPNTAYLLSIWGK